MLTAAVIALAAGFVVLSCEAVGPYWKLTPDSTTYVLGAQSLAEGKGYREAGAPAVLFPPGTAGILAAGWILGGKSYHALNEEVMLFALASLVLCFLVFRSWLGAIGSAVVVLLCLGSVELFQRSTFLLSEIFFLFFSLLAFWCYGSGRATGSVLSTLAAVMVRSVGVSLAAAFLLDSLIRRRWARAASYAMPLLFTVGWELRNRRLGWSYTRLMIQKEPWDTTSAMMTPRGMLARLVDNLAYGRAIEDVLTNGLTQPMHSAVVPGILLGSLMAVGFWRLSLNGKLANSLNAMGLYVILFSLTVALYWQTVAVRLFTPLIPFLYALLVSGAQGVAGRATFKWVYAAATPFLAWYLVTGYRGDRLVIADDRVSPFPSELARYPEHEDLQRLAVWWKAHSADDDVCAGQHASIIGVMTGRRGANYMATRDPAALENGMRLQHAGCLLLTMESGLDSEMAGVADRSRNFHLIRKEGQARLYELDGRDDQTR